MTIMGAQHIDEAVSLTTKALRAVADRDWAVPADGLDWSCYDTAVHVACDFTAYAGQLTARASEAWVPFEIAADPGTTPAGLIQSIEATGGILSAVVATSAPDVRAWHPYGAAGAEDFAAMGVVEAFVHTHDMLRGLGVTDWEPSVELCAAVLDRLFPHAPRVNSPWPTLLWATGRGELPGLPRLSAWRWHTAPIRTERLVLCEIAPVTGADLHAGGTGGFAWAEDGPYEGTRMAAGMVARAHEAGTRRPGWGAYAIVRAADATAVGGIGFHAAPDGDGNAEIGYDLVPSARGNGYATEAVRALAAWALAQPGLTTLHATVDDDNLASHAVVGRAGFTKSGAGEGDVRYTRTAV
ncbi:GNAT family N-acetyltransferase [Streptomyces sp. NBC_00536]|uniref:GNAT family N-acetyltransferase n=1 Tax=Streptomyces sp. NBC_00536 TaxID=2975769 RepID=UPI002E81FD28|nr:GNAT family N-acetyltransferase [Streptomyces sp. NBC_00536]WUC82755.1 GNAT family N-acetyltransferase [Streptomyces sp. NBC_00536]